MTKRNKPKSSAVIYVLILLAVVALGVLLYLNMSQRAQKEAAISMDMERQKWQEKVDDLGKTLPPAAGEVEETIPAPPPAPVDEPAAYKPAATEADITDPCRLTTARLDEFFTHMEQQPYFSEFQVEGDAKKFFTRIAEKLAENRPIVVRETDNLLSILQNTAHFYRILGEKDIFRLKKIMAHEKEALEPTMAAFYDWLEQGPDCRQLDYPLHLSLDDLYTYSAFFLNTLGGQAYLFRRDVTLRVLVKYYCILIIDKANDRDKNRFGIDIRFPLKTLIEEIQFAPGLTDRDAYLDKLLLLQDKYEQAYGPGT